MVEKNRRLNRERIGEEIPYGIYNQQMPDEILLSKIKLSEESFETISKRTGVPITMVYRHTKGDAPIDRDYAIKYAKYFGMDPSELLFNDISVPVKGIVSFDGPNIGEVLDNYSDGVYEFVKCPRDVYRPDIQAVRDSLLDPHCIIIIFLLSNN